MRRLALLFPLAAAACLGDPTGPEFVSGTPNGWFAVGGINTSYALGLNEKTPHSGSAALSVTGIDSASTGFRGVGQQIKADAFIGKRIRLSAFIKQDDLKGPTIGLWMRVDGQDIEYAFDNMTARHLQGTADWHVVEIILDVPAGAVGIAFGVLLHGSGTMLVDDMKLEAIPATGPTTDQQSGPVPITYDARSVYANMPLSPSNMDFEK